MVVVEAGPGQLEDELRLALSHAGVRRYPEIEHVRRAGGHLPQHEEIAAAILAARPPRRDASRDEVHA